MFEPAGTVAARRKTVTGEFFAQAAGATLVAMTDTVQPPGPGAGDDPGADDPGGRLAAYEARTQTPLDLLALATLWIVVVPATDFSTAHDVRAAVLAVQGAVRLVYAIDITIRSALARRHVHYLLTHPVALAAVMLPPVRVIFSLRLIRSVFRRGNLGRFLLAASVLVLNGAIVVYFFERDAKGSTIHTLGQSVWWAVTTVSTVGYGDYYPVTAGGQLAASVVMAIGILTIAVVTAQVASSFLDQSARARPSPPADPATTGMSVADLAQRLDRIETLLTSASPRPE